MAWAPHHFRQLNSAYMVGLREKRKARGVCQRCGRRKVKGFATCMKCRLERRAYYEKRGR